MEVAPIENQDQALVSLSNARLALTQCRTAMEAKKISDAMEAARVYLERTKASEEAVKEAEAIKALAITQMGEFLESNPKAQGVKMSGKDVEGVSVVDRSDRRTTLKEMGISKDESSQAQKLAKLGKEGVQLRILELHASGESATPAKILAQPRKVAKAVTPLPDIVAEQYEAAKATRTAGEAPTKKAMLAVLSRHFPNHVGALNDKPATVEDVYKAYPRHVAPRDALKAIANAMARHKLTADALLEITVKYAGAVAQWSARDREYIPHGATWFNRDSFLDDPKEWTRKGAEKAEAKKGAHDLA